MKKINKTKVIIAVILVLAILIGIGMLVFRSSDIEYIMETSEIEAKYYVLQQDYRYGVIDSDGKIVIDAQYDDIDIPNPGKDVLICKTINSNGEEIRKILNAKQEELFTEYNNVSTIELKNDENEIKYEKQVLQYEEDGKYGLIDLDGKKVTEAIYDKIEALKYKEGDLLVKQNNQYGVLNSKGKEVIKTKYDNIEGDGYYHTESKYTTTGYITCKKEKDGYKYGYINAEGKQLLNNEHSEIYRVLEAQDKQNVYLIARKNGKVGFIKNNKKVLDYEYQNIEYDSSNGLIEVQKNTKYGVYNINGEEIIPAGYDEISFRGKYIYTKKDSQPTYYTLNGQEVKHLNYLSINETDNENFYTCVDKKGFYGILDKNENQLVENEYNYLEYLYDDYFIAMEGDQLGVIKSNNDIMVPFEYTTIDKIGNANVVKATKQDGSTTFYAKDLKTIFDIENSIMGTTGDILIFYSQKTHRFFDQQGNELEVRKAFPENKLYAKQKNDKWGFEDKDGKEVVACQYDEVTELNSYGFAAIQKDGKWGSINAEGKIIIEPTYELEEGILPIFIGSYYTLEEGNEAIFYNK